MMIKSIKNHNVTYAQMKKIKFELEICEKSIKTHFDNCIFCSEATDFDTLCPEIKYLMAQYTYLTNIYKLAKFEYLDNIGTCNLKNNRYTNM